MSWFLPLFLLHSLFGPPQAAKIGEQLVVPKVHLISHRSCSDNPKDVCNKKYYEQLKAFSYTVSRRAPRFTEHHLFQGLPEVITSNPKWSRHISNFTRGRGYWFWKSALINLLLEQGKIKDGDVAVWHDPDEPAYFLNTFYDPADWSNLLTKGEWDIFLKPEGACERHWTKGDIFRKFNVSWGDAQYGTTMQVHALLAIFKINQKTRAFLKHWENLMSDFHLVSDEPSRTDNAPGWLENRHDQSMLSMLAKANNGVDRDEAANGIYQGCSENSSNKVKDIMPKLHPVYGVPGLEIKINDIFTEMKYIRGKQGSLTNASAAPTGTSSLHESSSASKPIRKFYVNEKDFDLDDMNSVGRLGEMYGSKK